MSQFRYLFSPAKIGKVELKNRIIYAPMLDRYANEDGSISDTSIQYYKERARGGAAMLIVGAVYFTPDSHYRPNQTGLWDDSLIPSHRKLTDAIHETGAIISCQLQHAGIRLAQKAFGAGRSTRPVGPSAIPFATTDAVPHALVPKEIHDITEAFATGARRARDAGYDVVDIHAGHGYLLHSFLSPFFNKRQDDYGGSVENRARFTCEVIRRIKETSGGDFPVNVRINGMDYLPGGIDIEQAMIYAQMIEEAGADAIHVSAGTRESRQYMIPGSIFPEAIYSDLAEKVKRVVKIPVMTVGRYIDPALCEETLARGKADFIIMGRALLADPELPNKAKEGRISDIRRCIGDNTGCAARDIKKFPRISCTVNAAVGREKEYRIEPAHDCRKVMVVGGGPAGMEAARIAAMRGHRVSLYEKDSTLGGQLIVASKGPTTSDIQKLIDYLIRQIQDLGVAIHTGVTINPELISQENPDVVIIATGSKPICPEIPGVKGENVMLARDVLMGKMTAGNRVVVVGGGLVGMEASLVLTKQGKSVALIEMLPKIGVNANTLELVSLMGCLIEEDVRILTNTKLLSIHPDGILVTMKQLTNENEVLFIKADSVVIAMGYRSSEDLSQSVRGSGRPVYVIGDSKEARKIIDAIHEGYQTALAI